MELVQNNNLITTTNTVVQNNINSTNSQSDETLTTTSYFPDTYNRLNLNSINQFLQQNPPAYDSESGNNNHKYQLFDTVFNDSSRSSPMPFDEQSALKITGSTPRSLEHPEETTLRTPSLNQKKLNQDPANRTSKMTSPVGVVKSSSNQTNSNRGFTQALPAFSESLSSSALNFQKSSSLSYQSNSLSDSHSHFPSNSYSQHQPLSQPRSSLHSQPSLDMNPVQFQFPLNNTVSSSAHSTNPHEQYYSNQSHPSSSSSIYTSASIQSPFGNSYLSTPGSQQLPQLNFPITGASSSPTNSYFPTQPNQNQLAQQYQQFQNQLPHPNDLQFQPRSQSYNDAYSSAANIRRYNWSLETPHSVEHKQEEFNEEDIRVLKSLLFNGEKVKWRYVSSKLSVITGRRATSTACSKKTRELFKTPSEKSSGSLGSSLPYVVHNSWESIVEEDI